MASDGEDDDLAVLRFLNSLFTDPPEPREPWPAPGVAGTLTAEMLASAIEEAQRPVLPDPPTSYDGLIDAMRFPVCGAVVLAPDESLKNGVKWELIARSIAVHPDTAAYLNRPVQGPTPLRCALDEHAEGTWHWDGRGTWFR